MCPDNHSLLSLVGTMTDYERVWRQYEAGRLCDKALRIVFYVLALSAVVGVALAVIAGRL